MKASSPLRQKTKTIIRVPNLAPSHKNHQSNELPAPSSISCQDLSGSEPIAPQGKCFAKPCTKVVVSSSIPTPDLSEYEPIELKAIQRLEQFNQIPKIGHIGIFPLAGSKIRVVVVTCSNVVAGSSVNINTGCTDDELLGQLAPHVMMQHPNQFTAPTSLLSQSNT